MLREYTSTPLYRRRIRYSRVLRMAGMRDPLAEPPPPSRFDPDDLDVLDDAISALEIKLPPFIAWSKNRLSRVAEGQVLRPQMLIVCVSNAACTLIHHLPGKRLLGSIILPQISMANNTAEPCVQDQTCCLYALDGEASIVAATVQYRVPPELLHAWVKTVFQALQPEATLLLEVLQAANFRSSLSPDEPLLFVLETDQQRLEDHSNHGIPYLPSGSLVDGLAAGVLTHCQTRGLRGRMLLSWPDHELHLLGSALHTLLGHLPGAQTLGFAQASKATLGKREISNFELYM